MDKLKDIVQEMEDDEFVIWDDIDGDFHDIANPEDSVRYVRDNYTEGNEMHPDFSSFIIYKKVGKVEAIEENDIVTEIKYLPKLKQIGEGSDEEGFEVLRKEEEFRALSKHNKAIINDLKEQRKQLHEKDEEIKHLKEGFEWIRKELSLSFPYHEYADNKPACEMALTINHVREYIVFEVLPNEGETEGDKK